MLQAQGFINIPFARCRSIIHFQNLHNNIIQSQLVFNLTAAGLYSPKSF